MVQQPRDAEVVITRHRFAAVEDFADLHGHLRLFERAGEVADAADDGADADDGLRKKLGSAGKYIETVRGVGYRFEES